MFKRLNSVAARFKIPLATARRIGGADAKAIEDLIENISEAPLTTDVFIYAREDLLVEIQRLRNPNFCGGVGSSSQHAKDASMSSWGSINLQFAAPTLEELRTKFADMRTDAFQTGIDDTFGTVHGHRAEEERFKDGEAVVASGSSARAQVYARRGCPSPLRPALWRSVLGARGTDATHLRSVQQRTVIHTVIPWRKWRAAPGCARPQRGYSVGAVDPTEPRNPPPRAFRNGVPLPLLLAGAGTGTCWCR